MFVPEIAGADSVRKAVETIESKSFDEQRTAVGPQDLDGFRSPPQASVMSVEQGLQSIAVRVTTPAPGVLMINETYFRAWDAGGLRTFPLDLDRLGVMVPAGEQTITLRFGRHRMAVVAAWMISLLVLAVAAAALRIEILDRGAGEIERSRDEDRIAAQA
jgi:hypothetical protein